MTLAFRPERRGFDLPLEGRIGLAVSGGPDSLALLLLAHDARPPDIVVATVDHGLRPEATDESAMVARICADRDIPHYTLAVVVSNTGDGLQAAARRARYAALADWAEAQDLVAVATAHHADDQAETLLLRLARGAGLSGLAGVRAARPIRPGGILRLVRPLLGWRKAELEAIVAAAGLVPVLDRSNHDPRFDRTRARSLLAAGWPDAVRVAASAHHLADAQEALDWTTRRLFAERVVRQEDAVEIDAADLPHELQRRLLLAALTLAGATAEPRGPAIERVRAALARGDTVSLGRLLCRGGPRWRLTPAPPRRSL